MTTNLDALLQRLRMGEAADRRKAAFQLSLMRNPVVVADLIRAAGDEDDGVRSFIASGLAALGTSALLKIETALANGDTLTRLTLVSALRHMDDASAKTLLQGLLDDDDADVAAAARAGLE